MVREEIPFASEAEKLAQMLDKAEKRAGTDAGSVQIVPLLESARGVYNTYEIACASDRIAGIAFGAGDYYRDLGRDVAALSFDETELLYARSHIVNASRAAGIQAIDTPYLGLLTDKERFLNEVNIALQLGFSGKQCIHPSQIRPVNQAFSPAEEQVAYSDRLVEAFKEAEAKGMGAISFEGKMIDRMSYLQAQEVLKQHQAMVTREKKQGDVSSVSIVEIFS